MTRRGDYENFYLDYEQIQEQLQRLLINISDSKQPDLKLIRGGRNIDFRSKELKVIK